MKNRVMFHFLTDLPIHFARPSRRTCTASSPTGSSGGPGLQVRPLDREEWTAAQLVHVVGPQGNRNSRRFVTPINTYGLWMFMVVIASNLAIVIGINQLG